MVIEEILPKNCLYDQLLYNSLRAIRLGRPVLPSAGEPLRHVLLPAPIVSKTLPPGACPWPCPIRRCLRCIGPCRLLLEEIITYTSQ